MLSLDDLQEITLRNPDLRVLSVGRDIKRKIRDEVDKRFGSGLWADYYMTDRRKVIINGVEFVE